MAGHRYQVQVIPWPQQGLEDIAVIFASQYAH